MIKIGILGSIGSGKSYVAKNFGYPVFNADQVVNKLYKYDRNIYNKLRKNLSKHIYIRWSFRLHCLIDIHSSTKFSGMSGDSNHGVQFY